MTLSRRALVLGILSALLAQGCSRMRATPSAQVDAQAAPAKPPEAPWSASVVARLLGGLDGLQRMKDDGLVLRSLGGLFVYTIDPRGTLARIGAPADYVPFLRSEADEELIGFEPTDDDPLHELTAFISAPSGSIERPFVRASANQIKHGAPPSLAWNGSAWTKAEQAPPPESADTDSYDHTENARAAGLPANHAWQVRHATKSAIVWIGHPLTATEYNVHHEYVTAVAPGPGKPAHLVDVPDPLVGDGGTTDWRYCVPLSSADDGMYIRCAFWTKAGNRAVERFYRLEQDRWAPLGPAIDLPRKDRGLMTSGSTLDHAAVVDAEGAIWYADARYGDEPRPTHLTRVMKSSEVARLDLPPAPRTPAAASYDAALPSYRPADGKLWRTTTLVDEPLPNVNVRGIRTLLARRSGDVWVIEWATELDQRQGTVLVRFARGADPNRTPLLVRSGADERNEVLNARAIRRWAGRCNSVFVPLDEASYEEHKPALGAAIAKLGKEPIEVALVRGSLDGRTVTGVVFLRTQPSSPLGPMETAIKRVIEIATKGPASSLDVTCSLPTLDRVVARLHGPP